MHDNAAMLRTRLFSWVATPAFLHLTTLLVWALVAYSAVAFVLRWEVGDAPVESAALGVDTGRAQGLPEVDATAVSKALGATPVQSADAGLASRWVLVGVMDGGPSHGVALLSLDGKPAKPYRLGQTVSDGLVVVGTGPRKAELGPQLGAAPTLVLELPAKK